MHLRSHLPGNKHKLPFRIFRQLPKRVKVPDEIDPLDKRREADLWKNAVNFSFR